MNFLAHLYLSGNDPFLQLGNFIADHVKGRAIELVDPAVRKGIMLHRKIDAFTDVHPSVMQSKIRLRTNFHKYAPVIADIFYDHFLAVSWKNYSAIPLTKYADDFYLLLKKHEALIPERTKKMLPYMISSNWLVSYATVDGLDKILASMARRTSFNSHMEKSAAELVKNYSLYQTEFEEFFPELEEFVIKEL
jgi:acyl carrier protein phosphodiesterase